MLWVCKIGKARRQGPSEYSRFTKLLAARDILPGHICYSATEIPYFMFLLVDYGKVNCDLLQKSSNKTQMLFLKKNLF